MDQVSEIMPVMPVGAVDVPQAISILVKQASLQEGNPYITLGVLTEGIVHTLAHAIPAREQAETAKAVRAMLSTRLRSHIATK